jgi:hypothetical protein
MVGLSVWFCSSVNRDRTSSEIGPFACSNLDSFHGVLFGCLFCCFFFSSCSFLATFCF